MRLTLATLNIWGLPEPFSRHLNERMDAIAAQLLEFDADVVALQEVWLGSAIERLLTPPVRERYPGICYQPGNFNSGGLLTLARYPVSAARFEPYLLRGYPERFDHADYYAGKGFLQLRLNTERGPVALVNTHLHAEYDEEMGDEYLAIRTGQALQLAAALRRIDEPLLALGDFNAGEAKPVYRVLTGLSGVHDSAITLDRRENTVRAANAYRSGKSSPDQRKDYIFYRDGAAGALRPLALRRVFEHNFTIGGETGSFSNHDGLLAQFELVEKTAADRFIPDPQILALAASLLQQGKYQAQLRHSRERGIGSATLAAGGVLMAAGLRRRYSRRRLLQRSLLALPVAAMLSGAGFLALSDLHGPAVLQAYDQLLELLDGMT